MTERAPVGYEIDDKCLVDQQNGERFLITNRSFAENDHRFRGLLSRLIKQKIQSSSKIVQVLDVGGGQESRSAREIADRYESEVRVANTDLLARTADRTDNFLPINASMFDLPFPDASFDLVYTRQVLTYFDKDHDLDKENKALAEIVRVLRPGGAAIVDDNYYSNNTPSQTGLGNLAEKLEVTFSQKQGGLFLSLGERLDKGLNPEFYPSGRFLVFQKQPLDPITARVIDSVPSDLKQWRVK